jgi:hypothetical protein
VKAPKGTAAGFCQSFTWGLKPIQWLDKSGFYTLPGERVVRIELESEGISGHYAGFLVTILHRQTGKIDAKFFAFNDYLRERSDNRADLPNQRFEVISHTGWGWYIAVPKDTRPFCAAIEAYIQVFS